MESSTTEAGQYFNTREGVSARLDYTLEWYEELGANLMEPSTARSSENIAELRTQRLVAQRDMGILAARLSEFDILNKNGEDAELDLMINNSKELVGVS